MQATAKMQELAKVVKSFGVDGSVVIRYQREAQEDINETEPVFIYFDGLPVPFFATSIKNRGNDQAIIKLEGIENEADANEITGSVIYLSSQSKGDENIEEPDPSMLVGYKVKDLTSGVTGIATNFFDYPDNPCLEIETSDDRVILIPLHEDFIKKFDPKKGTITMSLPAGLAEL